MKRTFLALLLMVSTAMTTTACGSKDDDPTPQNTIEQKLIGKWKITEIGLDSNNKEVSRIDDCTFWELLEGNIGNEIEYKMKNNECIPEKSNIIEPVNSFTWRVEDDYFIFKYSTGAEESKTKIKKITETTFEFERERFDSDNFDKSVVKILYQYQKIK